MAINSAEIDGLFELQEVTSENLPKYEAIRQAAKGLAHAIHLNTTRCADQTAAIRKVREAVATAYDAITLKGLI